MNSQVSVFGQIHFKLDVYIGYTVSVGPNWNYNICPWYIDVKASAEATSSPLNSTQREVRGQPQCVCLSHTPCPISCPSPVFFVERQVLRVCTGIYKIPSIQVGCSPQVA